MEDARFNELATMYLCHVLGREELKLDGARARIGEFAVWAGWEMKVAEKQLAELLQLLRIRFTGGRNWPTNLEPEFQERCVVALLYRLGKQGIKFGGWHRDLGQFRNDHALAPDELEVFTAELVRRLVERFVQAPKAAD